MPKTTEERLQELLDAKDEEIESVRTKLCETQDRVAILERRIDSFEGGWMLPEMGAEDIAELPLPRLEVRWFQMYENQKEDDWSSYRVTYSLILKHLTDAIVSIPMGMTTVQSGGKYGPPWKVRDGAGAPLCELPFRDGAHIHHDAGHLQVPAFAVFPDGTFLRIDGDPTRTSQAEYGRAHRRAP